MKFTLLVLGFLVLGSTGAFADISKDDIKELLRIGMSEGDIRTYVDAHRPVRSLTADDLRDLRAAGASNDLLLFLMTPVETPPPPTLSEDPSSYPSSNPYYAYPYYYGAYDPSYSYPYNPYSPYSPYYPYYPYYSFWGGAVVVPFHNHDHCHVHPQVVHPGTIAPFRNQPGMAPHPMPAPAPASGMHGGGGMGGGGHGHR